MMRAKAGSFCLAFSIIALLSAAVPLPAQTADAYVGTWTLNKDGLTTTLVLKAAGGGVTGTCFNTARNKNQKLLDVKVNLYTIHFVVDADDSGTVSKLDETYDGCLFYRDTRYMAGLSSGRGQEAWYAFKIGRVPKGEYPVPSPTWTDSRVIAGAVKIAYTLNEDVAIEFYNDKDEPVDMSRSHFVIEYQAGDGFKEFYTSRINPLDTKTVVSHGGKSVLWDQWDNEHKAKAKIGLWRVKFFVPGLKNSPFIKTFEIFKLKEL